MIESWLMKIFASVLIPLFTVLVISIINCAQKKANAPVPPPAAPAPAPPPPAKSEEVKKAEDLKPQVFEKNEKEKLIAEGNLKRNKHDYPTFDDVISDWDTEDDGEGGKKKKAAKDEKKEGEKTREKKSVKEKSKTIDAGGATPGAGGEKKSEMMKC